MEISVNIFILNAFFKATISRIKMAVSKTSFGNRFLFLINVTCIQNVDYHVSDRFQKAEMLFTVSISQVSVEKVLYFFCTRIPSVSTI